MADPKYTPPLNPVLAQWVDALDDDAREFFEERAGIREYDGGFPRNQAENLAWAETQRYLERRNKPAMGSGTPGKNQK